MLALLIVAPAGLAQETRVRAPELEWRGSLAPSLIEGLPPDTLLTFDPWLDAVVPDRPAPVTGAEGLPVVSGLDVIVWMESERARRQARIWREILAERLSGRETEEQGLIPELENPLRVPEPLARVFGEGSEFDIQGKLHLGALGARSRQDPDLRTELLRRTSGNFDLDLDQTLDLRILGTVGTKLDVAVDFNSQRELESKQLITAAYTGTEDELLQKVEVGDIAVTLPPSRYLGGSVGTGTFGAQAVGQVGPLDMRVLGTRKEGESTTRTLSITPSGEGVLSEVTLDIKDTQFQRDRFFLLFHPDSLTPGRLVYPNPGTTLRDPATQPLAGSLNVWLDDGNFSNNREENSKPGQSLVNPTDAGAFPEQAAQGFFDLLVEGQDYVVTDGIVLQMKRQLNDSEILAVSYLTVGGTQVGTPQEAPEQILKLIKPVNPDTLDFTWDYTLRNVYSLRETNIQLGSLELTVYRGNQDLRQTFETIAGESRKYSQVFGLTDPNGRVNLPRILRDPFAGPDFLVFPDVRPFFQPTDEAGGPIPIERPNRQMYFNNDPNRTALDDQVYFIEAEYLSRGGLTGEIELGSANVIEGSERISIGSETLIRGEDYQIVYELGRLVLTDPAGLAERHPADRLTITFEVAPLFNLAPTTLYGAAGSYRLGEAAVLNGTLMLQRKESLANRPILGAEPTQTMIAELDGSWTRPMTFMDRWLDGLPGATGDTPSRVALRGEMALSRPDPNTDGEVFLHDFENIEIAKRVGLFFRIWRSSSVPAQSGLGLTGIGDLRWYTFFIPREQVTGERRGIDVGDNQFFVIFDPRGETPAERLASWRSVATVLSAAGEDLTRQEFVEFFVRGGRGKMIVDLGTVDEDAVRVDRNGAPVGLGLLDTEEANPDTRDNNLDVNEDTGLDAVDGQDVLTVPGDDGNDDFNETFGPGSFPINPNGTENNSVLDTEDHNLNLLLDRQEDLLRWEVDLSDDRYVVPGSQTLTGFRRIRLPLVTPDQVVGAPDLRNVRVLRLTLTGVESSAQFQIVDLEIVGSTFLKRGIVAEDGTPLAGQETDSLQITSISDLENRAYTSPPGVFAEQDRADEIAGVDNIVREQSLELTFKGLPDGATGTIFRPLFDRESYIDYETMRVWVQGRPVEGAGQPNFLVSFGIDTLNVYEYAAPLLPMEWEEHVIDFAVFTELKRALLDSLGQAGADTGVKVSDDGRYRVRLTTTDSPPPTITEIGQLTIGVENTTGGPATGSFWINEWRLTSPLRESGVAGYVNAQARLADLAQVDLTFETRSARYRNLNAFRNNFDSGDLDVNAMVRLDQLLPESWGVSVPLTWNHFGGRDVPLYRVASDILVTSDAERDSIERTNRSELVTLRAFRARQSLNPLIGATLDRLELRVTYRNDEFGSVDLNSDRGRWDTYLGYRNGFRRRALPLPLDWLTRLPLPGFLKGGQLMQRLASADLNLAPANVTLSANTSFAERTEAKLFAGGTDFTADTTRNLVSRAVVEFQPFNSMRARIGYDNTRDFVFPETVIRRPTWGTDVLRSQNFSFDWTPPLASWLVPRYTYTSDFSRNHTREASRSLDTLDLRDFGVAASHNFSLQLGLPELVRLLESDERETAGGVVTATGGSWWQRFFEPIRYDARRNENVFYVQEQDDPTFGFGWGFGDLDEENGRRPQNFGRLDDWGLSAGIEPLTGMILRGAYRETDDTRRYLEGVNLTSTRVWPSVDLQWRNIQLPGFLRTWVATSSMTSGFERRTNDNVTNDQLLSDTDRRQWDPILSVGFTLRNGLSTDLRATNSQLFTTQVRAGVLDSRREENATDYLLNLNYNIKPGTTLYIPFPTLWGVKLKQPLLTSLSVSRRYRLDETTTPQSEAPVLNLKTVTTEVRPSVAYEFGRIVSGFAINYQSREDEKRDIRNTTIGMEAFLDFLF